MLGSGLEMSEDMVEGGEMRKDDWASFMCNSRETDSIVHFIISYLYSAVDAELLSQKSGMPTCSTSQSFRDADRSRLAKEPMTIRCRFLQLVSW